MVDRVCLICGINFNTNHSNKRTCSNACRDTLRKQTTAVCNGRRTRANDTIQCCECGCYFKRTGPTSKYCSMSCRRKYNDNKRSKSCNCQKICPVCKVCFVTNNANKLYCGQKCKKSYHYSNHKEYYQAKWKKYNAENKQKLSDKNYKWRKENKDKISNYAHDYSRTESAKEARKNRYYSYDGCKISVKSYLAKELGHDVTDELVELATARRLLRRAIKKAGE